MKIFGIVCILVGVIVLIFGLVVLWRHRGPAEWSLVISGVTIAGNGLMALRDAP